jgi:DNA repair protein RecO (recombination protein O)
LFQPLTLLELEVYHKARRDLQKIKEVRNHSPFVHLTGDPLKGSVAIFLSEILNRALREEEANEELFDFISTHIQYLDLMEEGVANFHLYFLLRLTRHLGFHPGDPPAGEGLWFDLSQGTFSPQVPLHDSFLAPEMTALLIRFLSVQVSDLATISIDRTMRAELLDNLLKLYYLHLDGLGEIKSHQVLKALFD